MNLSKQELLERLGVAVSLAAGYPENDKYIDAVYADIIAQATAQQRAESEEVSL